MAEKETIKGQNRSKELFRNSVICEVFFNDRINDLNCDHYYEKFLDNNSLEDFLAETCPGSPKNDPNFQVYERIYTQLQDYIKL